MVGAGGLEPPNLVRVKLTQRRFWSAPECFQACFRGSAFVFGTPGHPREHFRCILLHRVLAADPVHTSHGVRQKWDEPVAPVAPALHPIFLTPMGDRAANRSPRSGVATPPNPCGGDRLPVSPRRELCVGAFAARPQAASRDRTDVAPRIARVARVNHGRRWAGSSLRSCSATAWSLIGSAGSRPRLACADRCAWPDRPDRRV